MNESLIEGLIKSWECLKLARIVVEDSRDYATLTHTKWELRRLLKEIDKSITFLEKELGYAEV